MNGARIAARVHDALTRDFNKNHDEHGRFAGGGSGLWSAPQQEISSAKTSINATKMARTFKLVDWQPGTRNADIGGGRFDNATAFLASKGVDNVIYDPFNRSAEHNAASAARILGGQADTATINNVLNVIKEPANRDHVIRQAADAIKPGGTAYFLVYEGSLSGHGAPSTAGWQENRKTASFLPEIAQHFGTVRTERGMIVASHPRK